MKKRLLLVLLCIIMAICLMPTVVFAAPNQTELDISKGNIVIGKDSVLGYNSDGTVTEPNSNGYKIIGTTNKFYVNVRGGTHNITLNGVSIDVTVGASAFAIDAGAEINLTLEGTNTLKSVVEAGLKVPEGAKLTITKESTGSLSATSENGAGIGCGEGFATVGNGGTVTISGGTVTATSSGGAGIGGGSNGGNGGTVTVSGGNLKATSEKGAGIGGGEGVYTGGNGGTVTISGGNVKATSTKGAGIGDGSGAEGGDGGTLKNAENEDIYLVTLTLDGAAANTPMKSLMADRYSYGMNDVKTMDDNLYLYLPEGTTVSGVITDEDTPGTFINRSATAITVENGNNTAGTLTEVFSVTLPSGTGYTAIAEQGSESPVVKGGSYSFKITLDSDYEKSAAFAVKANDTVLSPVGDVYTIENITSTQTVTIEGVVKTTWDNPFTDVKESDWFFKDVMFVYENELMLGTSATTFSPNDITTRAMIAVTIWRMEGSPKVTGSSGFSDVEGGKWYSEAITWAKQNGIVSGYSDTIFAPDTSATREQLALFLYRYADYKGYDTGVTGSLERFTDKADISDWAADAMKWAVGCGVVLGNPGNLLDPQGIATRAQLAAMLHRLIEKNEQLEA